MGYLVDKFLTALLVFKILLNGFMMDYDGLFWFLEFCCHFDTWIHDGLFGFTTLICKDPDNPT